MEFSQKAEKKSGFFFSSRKNGNLPLITANQHTFMILTCRPVDVQTVLEKKIIITIIMIIIIIIIRLNRLRRMEDEEIKKIGEEKKTEENQQQK